MQNPNPEDLAQKFNYDRSYIWKKMRNAGIYTQTKIANIIREQGDKKSDEEIAAEAHVYPEAVSIIREEVRNEEFIKVAMQEPNAVKLAQKFGCTRAWIYERMKKFGISTKTQIKKMIEEQKDKSDEEIAAEAHVYPEAVSRIREKIVAKQEEPKEAKPQTELGQQKLVELKQAIEEQEDKKAESQTELGQPIQAEPVQESEELKEGKTFKKNQQTEGKASTESIIEIKPELEKEIRRELGAYPAVAAIAKKLKVSIEVVLQVQRQMEQEKYDRTHTEIHFKIKRAELLSRLKSAISISEVETQIIEIKADKLLAEFSKFLTTEEDYELIAYAYVKARKYQKAIEIGEEYLGLETPSILALEQKLRENPIQLDQKKKAQGDSLKTSKKPEDEEVSL